MKLISIHSSPANPRGSKIPVMKELRHTYGIPLISAKHLIDELPADLPEVSNPEDQREFVDRLLNLGARISTSACSEDIVILFVSSKHASRRGERIAISGDTARRIKKAMKEADTGSGCAFHVEIP